MARKEKRKSNEPNIFCICKGIHDPVPMHAKMKPKDEKYSYTLVRNPNTMHQHSPECIRYSERLMIENEVEEEFEGMNMEKHSKQSNDKVVGGIWEEALLYSNNYKVKELVPNEDIKHEKSVRRKSTSKYTAMYTMLEKITTFAWYKYVTNKNNNSNPKEGNLFHYIYTVINDMEIRNSNIQNVKESKSKITLGKILFKPGLGSKNEDITKQLLIKRRFVIGNKIEVHKTLVIGKYLSHEDVEENKIRLQLQDPYQKNYYYLYGNKQQILNGLRFKVSEASLYVIAYITPVNNMAMIDSIDSMPVLNNRGIYVQSSYEIDYAEELIEKNILFFRPPSSENPFKKMFNGNIPDFLLLDRNSRMVATICEVFGYKKDNNSELSIKYWEKARKKMAYYETLRDSFYTNYWYPLGKESISVFEPNLKKKQRK